MRAVKKRVGDKISVMSDFNQRLTVNEAILRGRMLDDEGLYWIEEPMRHDDYAGYARICAELHTPIQTGENLLNTFELAKAIAADSLDYVMPDVQRIGGVTGWLRAAALAHAHGIEMSSHLFPEFSRHLLAVTPTCHWLEYVDWAAPVLAEPAQVKDGNVLIDERPGAGIAWNEEAVKRFAGALNAARDLRQWRCVLPAGSIDTRTKRVRVHECSSSWQLQTAIDELRALFGERLSTSTGVRDHHSKDESWHHPHRPDAVVFPEHHRGSVGDRADLRRVTARR